jgi:translation initiation factor 5B
MIKELREKEQKDIEMKKKMEEIANLKKEGKYLTKKQKQESEKARQMFEKQGRYFGYVIMTTSPYFLSGLIPAALLSGETKKKPIYGKKKTQQKSQIQDSPSSVISEAQEEKLSEELATDKLSTERIDAEETEVCEYFKELFLDFTK